MNDMIASLRFHAFAPVAAAARRSLPRARDCPPPHAFFGRGEERLLEAAEKRLPLMFERNSAEVLKPFCAEDVTLHSSGLWQDPTCSGWGGVSTALSALLGADDSISLRPIVVAPDDVSLDALTKPRHAPSCALERSSRVPREGVSNNVFGLYRIQWADGAAEALAMARLQGNEAGDVQDAWLMRPPTAAEAEAVLKPRRYPQMDPQWEAYLYPQRALRCDHWEPIVLDIMHLPRSSARVHRMAHTMQAYIKARESGDTEALSAVLHPEFERHEPYHAFGSQLEDCGRIEEMAHRCVSQGDFSQLALTYAVRASSISPDCNVAMWHTDVWVEDLCIAGVGADHVSHALETLLFDETGSRIRQILSFRTEQSAEERARFFGDRGLSDGPEWQVQEKQARTLNKK